MDHIPTPKIDRNPAVEAAARMRDVTDRAKAVHPVAQGADLLKGVSVRANHDPFGSRYDDIL